MIWELVLKYLNGDRLFMDGAAESPLPASKQVPQTILPPRCADEKDNATQDTPVIDVGLFAVDLEVGFETRRLRIR